MSFSVRVEGIRFSAAHFATYRDDCEPLHGHTYEVAAEVHGPLTSESWVLDFAELKAILRAACASLDHRFVLQRASRILRIERLEESWSVRTPAGAAYVFPSADVADLDIDNSTAERLAEYISGQVREALGRRGIVDVDQLAVEVWEGSGQRARHRSGRAGSS